MRTILIATLLGLAACGGANPERACEDVMSAAEACAADMGVTGTTTAVDANYCATTYGELKGDAADAAVELLNCQADAYNGTDCASTEGMMELVEALAACAPAAEAK